MKTLKKIFYLERCWQIVLQVINFVNKCKDMFSIERLRIFKCTGIKCLLETNLSCSVRPTNEWPITINLVPRAFPLKKAMGMFRAEKSSAQASAHPLSQAQGGLFCVLVCLSLREF